MHSKFNANTVYIRKNEDINFDLNQLQQIFQPFHPSEIKLLDDGKSHNDKEESMSLKNEDTKVIGSLIFAKIEDAEMLFALFHHDQLELEYNSLSVMRYTKDLYTCYVKHIPSSFDQLAVDLYNVFRKHGSIHKCQVLTNDTAIVQYYSFKNCDKAVNELDGTSFPGFPDIKMSVSAAMTYKTKTKKKRPANLKLKNPTKSMSEPSTVNHTSSAATPASFRSYHYSPSTRPLSSLKYPVFEIKPSMDLCNLYIKGLDTDMTSIDLFNLFKPFGRIISAKVMEANNEGLKNFGFVSFSHPIEAAKAMIELYSDQQFNIIVKFHEPKQHQRRSEQDFYQQLLLLRHSTLSRHFYTTSCYNNEKSPIPPIPPLPQAYQTPPQPQQVYAYYVPVITQPIIAANNNGTFVYQNHSTPTSHYYYYQPPLQPYGIISEQEPSTHFTKTKFNRERHSSSKNK